MPSSKAFNSKKLRVTKGSSNVFRDLGFPAEEAANLLARTDLVIAILKTIDKRKLTPAEAAEVLCVAPTRISELRQGKIEKFSVDLLLNYLARLGKQVKFSVRDVVG
jgi:predicted XRE-type DNA-binding protein